MPNVKVSVPFQIQQDEALNRVKARLTEIKSQYGNMVSNLTENWNGYVGTFSGSARGFSVSGTVTVDPSVATVEFGLPLAAVIFRGKIEAAIRDELTILLA